MHDTGCLGLVHWDDPEGGNGEGEGRRVQNGEGGLVAHGKAFELHSEGTREALEDLGKRVAWSDLFFIFLVFIYLFIFRLYITVLVLPNIKMNPPQVYTCSPF